METETQQHHRYPQPPSLAEIGLADPATVGQRRSGADLPKMKKFRFQLLGDWIADNFSPCRVADVGGGKGMLAYLLGRQGFDAVVIDPMEQALPDKFKDLRTGARVRIGSSVTVPRITERFTNELGAGFDMLVALHSHGSNIAIIETCVRHPVIGVILPCCVIDEPQVPPVGENWFMWLVGLARQRGLSVELFALNFSGQNVGIVVRGPTTAAGSDGWGQESETP